MTEIPSRTFTAYEAMVCTLIIKTQKNNKKQTLVYAARMTLTLAVRFQTLLSLYALKCM